MRYCKAYAHSKTSSTPSLLILHPTCLTCASCSCPYVFKHQPRLTPRSLRWQAERKAATIAPSNVSFRQGDVEQVEFAEGSFDAILCSSALIYFSDVPGTIRRFMQWLRPGGKLAFNTPQAKTPLNNTPINANLRYDVVKTSKGWRLNMTSIFSDWLEKYSTSQAPSAELLAA